MKKPDEIKKGLELHNTAGRCKECPYTADSEFKKTCFQLVAADALAYIQQLEEKCHQLERERDALRKDIKALADAVRYKHGDEMPCFLCKYNQDMYVTESGEWSGECPGFDKDDCFGWHGVKAGEVLDGKEKVLSEYPACLWIHFTSLDMARKFANQLLDSIEILKKRDNEKESEK